MRRLLPLLLLLAFPSLSCMPQVERTIPANKIGTKYARLTGYFGTSNWAPGGRHEESTPGQIRHDRIRDEATLMRMADGETCVAVMIRTESKHDEPLEQLAPKCKSDKGNGDAIVENERIRVVDYDFKGMSPVVQADGVAADNYMGLAISKPTDKIFRVVERQASVCCLVAGHKKLELHMENKRWTSYSATNRIEFVWNFK